MTGTDRSLQPSRRTLLRAGVLVGATAAVGPFQLRLASGAAAAPAVADCATWGAEAPRGTIDHVAPPTNLVVHHTASANSTDYSEAHAHQLARDIQQWHFGNGWIDSGQQLTISRGGYVMEGRHESLGAVSGGVDHVLGAHVANYNSTCIGIENEGTYTSEGPTQALWDSLVETSAWICGQYGIPSASILGHRDFNSTECPGEVLYGMLPDLRVAVGGRIGERVAGAAQSWPTVRRGAHGARVRAVQHLLRQGGQPVTVDGVFGAGTVAAVRAFRDARRMPAAGTVGGSVGPRTWESLVTTVMVGSHRPDARADEAVRAAQLLLADRGYAVAVDGRFTGRTAAAVSAFQTDRGLPADGIVGPATWSRLLG